ncbi:MAG: ATP12 family chaperone protein [Beijerinckiaceae bacterium]
MSNDQRNFLEALLTNDMDPAAYDPVRSARASIAPQKMRRFWKQAGVEATGSGYALTLDGKMARTPSRQMLVFPAEALAEAIAEEWQAVGENVDPLAMPLTRLANSAIDGVATQPESVVADAAKYAASDLLCYRAEGPETLVSAQALAWDPILNWVEDVFQAPLRPTHGIGFIAQDQPSLDRLQKAVAQTPPPFALAALHSITTLTGSVLLALALRHGRLTSDQAWKAAHIDEDFQAAQWGQDEEAQERRAQRRAEFDAAVLMLALAG